MKMDQTDKLFFHRISVVLTSMNRKWMFLWLLYDLLHVEKHNLALFLLTNH